MVSVIQDGGRPIKMWTDGVQVEDEARKQLVNVSRLPFIAGHVAAMPDVHWGMGATVGSVIPTEGAIVPAAVGVDIGCGMQAVRFKSLRAEHLPDSLAGVRSAIEASIPHGRTNNGGPGDRGAWGDVPSDVIDTWDSESHVDGSLAARLSALLDLNPGISGRRQASATSNNLNHLGTLGTGNHFIEVCLDAEGAVWVMLHSGSRGIGNRIGQYFIDVAKKDMETWHITLPDKDLAYLPEGTEHFNDYIDALHWAQDFAKANRKVMMARVFLAVVRELRPDADVDDVSVMAWGDDPIDCHHNYTAKEHHGGKNIWITRKGAVRAREGDLGIIPGSMGARSFIVRGKGNPESFCSCSHGAGRAMSRGQAKRTFTLEDHAKATEGVECRKDADVIDETPGAYKPIDAVMAAQADLVDVVHELHQVVCVKG